MSATIPCPECNAPLKRPGNYAPGKRIRCPQCDATFDPTEDEPAPTGVTGSPRALAPGGPALEKEQPTGQVPRRGNLSGPRRKRGGSAGIIIGLVAGGIVLLGSAAVLVFALWYWRAPEKATQPVVQATPPVVEDQKKGPPPIDDQQQVPPPFDGKMGRPPVGPVGPGPFGPLDKPEPPPLKIGEVAPEIEGKDLDGKAMKLSDFRGKVVVLDFWGDWCPWCKAAYTYQRDLVRRMEGRSFVLLGVNCDDTADQARLVVKNQRITWRSWFDGPRGMTGPVYKRWGIQAVPSVFVLDTKGVLRQTFSGAPRTFLLEQTVESLLPAAERGRPRWLASEQLLERLGPEVEIGVYRMRSPPDYHLERREPEPGRQVFVWRHTAALPGGVPAQLEVTLVRGAKDEPASAIEKALGALSCLRQGWSCSMAQRGEVNGQLFYRVNWFGLESASKRSTHGFVYAARDGDVLIQIVGRGGNLDRGTMVFADAAALTLRKPAK
jgi:peroxiredoxin